MTSKIIAAIVAIAAAVLSLAAPVAVEAQPVEPVTFACSEAADSAVWRFYTAVSLPPLVHDFDARSNLPTDKIGLHVEQYAGDWNTRLSIPAGNLEPYAAGSTRLQAGQWTDVGVQCEGEGEVTLTVTRRRAVSLRRSKDPTASSEAGKFTGSCPGGDRVRYFDVEPEHHMDLAAYTTNPDSFIDMNASLVAVVRRQSSSTVDLSIAKGSRRGSLHITGSISIPAWVTVDDPRSIGFVYVYCNPSDEEEDEVTVTVTRREPVSLRRR